MGERITHHYELDVYKKGIDAAMRIFELSRTFPKRGNIFLNESDSALIPVGMRKFVGSLAEASI